MKAFEERYIENRTKAAMTKWLLRSIECDRLLPFVCIRKNPVCLMNDGDLLSTAHSPLANM